MSITAKGQSDDYERIPAPKGNHLAICYMVIDLGTKKDKWNNMTRNVRFVWELCNEFKELKDSDEKIPFSVSRDFSLYVSPGSNLTEMLQGWRGQDFTEKEREAFDVSKVIGKACQVNVIHKISQKNNVYAFVSNVSQIMKNIEIPLQYHNSVVLSFEDIPYNMEVYKKLPKYLQEKIAESVEWKAMNGNNEENIEEETIQDNTKFDAGDESIKEDKEINEEKTTAEYSIEELQDKIRKLVGIKYGQEHQSIAVKQWLESMSIQGCKDNKKLEKFLVHLETMKDIKKEEDVPF